MAGQAHNCDEAGLDESGIRRRWLTFAASRPIDLNTLSLIQ